LRDNKIAMPLLSEPGRPLFFLFFSLSSSFFILFRVRERGIDPRFEGFATMWDAPLFFFPPLSLSPYPRMRKKTAVVSHMPIRECILSFLFPFSFPFSPFHWRDLQWPSIRSQYMNRKILISEKAGGKVYVFFSFFLFSLFPVLCFLPLGADLVYDSARYCKFEATHANAGASVFFFFLSPFFPPSPLVWIALRNAIPASRGRHSEYM